MFETKRLILRNYKESDIDDYFEYASNTNVGPRCGWDAYSDKESAFKRLQHEITKPHQFTIVWKETNKVIGSIDLFDCKKDRYSNLAIEDGAKEIGFLLSPAFWGKGIMTEASQEILKFAFESLDVPVVYIGHAKANIQSAKVQDKLGFKIVGELQNYRVWVDGKTTSLIERKMTKNDWKYVKNLPQIAEYIKNREPIFHHREFTNSRATVNNEITLDYFEISASGKDYSRDFVLDYLEERYKNEQIDAMIRDGWHIEDFRIKHLAENTYLVNYTLHGQGRITKRGEIWKGSLEEGLKIMYHQGTIVKKTTD